MEPEALVKGEVRVLDIASQERPIFDAPVSLTADPAPPVARSTQTSGIVRDRQVCAPVGIGRASCRERVSIDV